MLIVLPEPEPTSEAEPEHTPEFTVVEPPAPMPDYVIDEPEGPPPVVVPDPEPEPELGPLPDFVVEPGSAPEPAPMPVESALVPEEEEDLGPLPDFVIDPSLPPELRPAPPPTPVPVQPEAAVPPLKVPTSEKPEPTMSNAAGLYFPPTTAFPIPRDDDDGDAPRGGKRAPRPRPAAELGKSKRSTEPAEPGDEGNEVGWMAGLSNRLSAYSLSDDEAQSASEPDAHEPLDENTED